MPDFTPQIKPTTPVSKREPQVERPPPPPVVPVRRGVGNATTGIDVTPTFYTPPNVDIRGAGRGLPVGADRDALPIVRVPPDYPARAANFEGWVQVRFTVTAIGTVRDAVVVASEPGTVFDDAALKSIARWRYNPRVENGVAVERVGLQALIRFELEE